MEQRSACYSMNPIFCKGLPILLDEMFFAFKVVGSLYVESKTLRNALLPITQNTLESIKGLLLGMARDSCINALQDITDRVTVLMERPAALEDFMAYQVLLDLQCC